MSVRKTIALSVFLLCVVSTASLADVPRLMTYQGQLTETNGQPIADGTYEVVFALYADSIGGSSLWTETQMVDVADGLFNVQLGLSSELNEEHFAGSSNLFLSLTIVGETEMQPRTRVTSHGFAFRARNADFADTAMFAHLSGLAQDGDWTVTSDVLTTIGEWGIARAGNMLHGDFINTHVNLGVTCTTGTSAANDYRYETVSGGFKNVAEGRGAAVGGGILNRATGDRSVINGGRNNQATGEHSIIGGGSYNQALEEHVTISGGTYNIAHASNNTIGGGFYNEAHDRDVTIGGGAQNVARSGYSTIAGGYMNKTDGPPISYACATVGGGHQNDAMHVYATVAGGGYNKATASRSTIGGGMDNRASDTCAVVCGGGHNYARGQYSVVVGGGGGIGSTDSNAALGDWSFVGGGRLNVADAGYAVIAGGESNFIDNSYSVVGGGLRNVAGGWISAVLGGQDNIASSHYTTVGGGLCDSALAYSATVGGGAANAARNEYSTIGGGRMNEVDGYGGVVAGGEGNWAKSPWSTVAGGLVNHAIGTTAVVCGGMNNYARGYSSAIVGGGYFYDFADSNSVHGDYSIIGAGKRNYISSNYSVVGGGYENVAGGTFATVPGGRDNNAAGQYSFAAGYRAKASHFGSFVWADGTDADFASTENNQFLIRAAGGVGIGTTSPETGYKLHVNGLAWYDIGGGAIALSTPGGWPGMIMFSPGNKRRDMIIKDDRMHIITSNSNAAPATSNGITIMNDGSVGIGTDGPNYKLDVRGTIGNNTTLHHSDRRWKTNVEEIPAALEKVSALRGVNFEWRQDEFTEMNFPDGIHLGVIAQEVEEVLPQLVHTAADGYKSVEYANLTALLIEAVKELRLENQVLKQRLENLEEKVLSK